MDHNGIVKNAETHVRELYQTHFKPEFVYHNLDHVQSVVKAAGQVAGHYQLEGEDEAAVLIASWFHDTGYLFNSNDHEERSAELAVSFLKQEKAEESLITKVKECILATKIFKKSPSLIAKIVSDADLFHLGTSEFWRSNKRMREEMNRRFGKDISAEKWQRGTLSLLKRHRFETDFCKNRLREGKKENITQLQEWLEVEKRKRT